MKKIRHEPGRYEVSVKYTTASAANNGTYSITFNDQAFAVTVVPTPSEPQARTETVGMVRLAPGEYEIQVRPTDIRGGELMRLFNVSLVPKSEKIANRFSGALMDERVLPGRP